MRLQLVGNKSDTINNIVIAIVERNTGNITSDVSQISRSTINLSYGNYHMNLSPEMCVGSIPTQVLRFFFSGKKSQNLYTGDTFNDPLMSWA